MGRRGVRRFAAQCDPKRKKYWPPKVARQLSKRVDVGAISQRLQAAGRGAFSLRSRCAEPVSRGAERPCRERVAPPLGECSISVACRAFWFVFEELASHSSSAGRCWAEAAQCLAELRQAGITGKQLGGFIPAQGRDRQSKSPPCAGELGAAGNKLPSGASVSVAWLRAASDGWWLCLQGPASPWRLFNNERCG